MHGVRAALGILPVLTFALAVYLLRPYPRRQIVGPKRLAVLRAAVLVGGLSIISVEALSAGRAVHSSAVTSLWITAVVIAGLLATRRFRSDRRYRRQPEVDADRKPADGKPTGTEPTGAGAVRPVHWILLGALAALFAAELVLAFAAPPNTWDSNYYHLPKIEHWVRQHSVELYPTRQLPQVILVPGAEYLLLHLRLLTGGDALYNLLQWSAGVGAALAVSRIAGQLGAGRTGQLLAAAAFVTAPMVVLQSTSTQTDLAAAAWLVCLASLVLDEIRRVSGPTAVVFIGAAAGMAAVTKSTTLMGVAVVLLVWGLAQLRQRWPATGALPRARGVLTTVTASLCLVAVALVLVGPMMMRLGTAFGSPLGPAEHSRGMSMQRHDPAAITVNALRIASSTMVVPLPEANAAVAGAVTRTSNWLGVDVQDRTITLGWALYPNPRWKPDEDHSPYPLQAALVLAAIAASLAVRRVPPAVRVYALSVVVSFVLFAAAVKWQTWGNRLTLPYLALATPLVGWWLARPGGQGTRSASRTVPAKLVAGLVAATMVVAFAGAYGSVLFGWPRRLVGQWSAITTPDWQLRFARNTDAADGYRFAADRVRQSGAQRVGIVVAGDSWEYPLWVLLPDREFVWLESLVPGRPAGSVASVDAVVCVTPPAQCQALLPAGWRYETRGGWVGVGLPGAGVPGEK